LLRSQPNDKITLIIKDFILSPSIFSITQIL
jgi:hypothetical protein